eukprot:CAMPEP_0177292976 /NCGR_PEP_ID=MMETSP0368-20130122/493_1 /TAXON_ID=447022 ORGANISM="Scrippsiella hangoei-like, Strain SHHI-4" /NCGR_SAMPLE_ID=MMETSP0368 /ASSEMBLY_ACC=CAM_ASM_000363 /LENGTH=161 /DNA_ID=CAMNT_0018750705 /DNA_START=162 /DNA_END=644 /DNA_ORIENTATION=+
MSSGGQRRSGSAAAALPPLLRRGSTGAPGLCHRLGSRIRALRHSSNISSSVMRPSVFTARMQRPGSLGGDVGPAVQLRAGRPLSPHADGAATAADGCRERGEGRGAGAVLAEEGSSGGLQAKCPMPKMFFMELPLSCFLYNGVCLTHGRLPNILPTFCDAL